MTGKMEVPSHTREMTFCACQYGFTLGLINEMGLIAPKPRATRAFLTLFSCFQALPQF